MSSTFGGLELGKRALFTQQTALTITGQNIANANTQGYSRQRANMSATYALPGPGTYIDHTPGQIGTGVEITDIERIRDTNLDNQYRSQNSDNGYWSSMSSTFDQIEGVLKEPSDTGLQSSMDKFWQAWQGLTTQPDSTAQREVVVQSAKSMSDTFQQLTNSLTSIKNDTNNVLNSTIDNVNSYVSQITDLNDQIQKVTQTGNAPNDLADKRDLLIDKLSQLVSVNVTPSQYGMVNISAVGSNGELTSLVNGNQTSGTFDSSVPVKGGQVAALEKVTGNNGTIDTFVQQLNSLATTMANQVNTLHKTGYSLDGTNKNLPFFIDKDWYQANASAFTSNPPDDSTIISAPDPTSADKMMVNPLLASEPNDLAASTLGMASDGSLASQIANLKSQSLTNLNNSSIDQYYQTTISNLGSQSQGAQQLTLNTQASRDAFDNQRQSISGVSLDEEMTNMVKYQQAYSAAAKVISTMNTMLDTLINGIGIS